MHNFVGIIVPKVIVESDLSENKQQVLDYIENALAPYSEDFVERKEGSEYLFDWYRVGGRFNGFIMGNTSEGGFNYGDQYSKVQNNCLTVKKHLNSLTVNNCIPPLSIVDATDLHSVSVRHFDHEPISEYLSFMNEKNPENFIVGLDMHW